jgi:hypothetical protein
VYRARQKGLATRLANLRRGGPKKGLNDKPVEREKLLAARRQVLETVADSVSGAMVDMGHNQLGRRLKRDMGRALCGIYREDRDVRLFTLTDIAAALNAELVIEIRPRGTNDQSL